MRAKVFIDGREGTTGLRIMERFAGRDDIELIAVSEEKRKDPEARAACINASDYTFLCLPDTAAREAVSLVTNEHVQHDRRLDCAPNQSGLGLRFSGAFKRAPQQNSRFRTCGGARLIMLRDLQPVSIRLQAIMSSRRTILCAAMQ